MRLIEYWPVLEVEAFTEERGEGFWNRVEADLRSIVRSAKFRSGDESEADELYDDVCEDLTLMGCGRFHGYVEAFREIWADK
jgi:hypothetical protein